MTGASYIQNSTANRRLGDNNKTKRYKVIELCSSSFALKKQTNKQTNKQTPRALSVYDGYGKPRDIDHAAMLTYTAKLAL